MKAEKAALAVAILITVAAEEIMTVTFLILPAIMIVAAVMVLTQMHQFLHRMTVAVTN